MHTIRIQRILAIAWHRNGICGAPFHAVIFDDRGEEGSRKLGIVFDQESHVAVLDLAKLTAGNVTFGHNSWRGDHYEAPLRRAIADHETTLKVPHDAAPQNANTAATQPVPFDDYEIHGVAEENGVCEPVSDDKAEFWSLYGHIPGQGAECIGDFTSREAAEKIYARITGCPYSTRTKESQP